PDGRAVFRGRSVDLRCARQASCQRPRHIFHRAASAAEVLMPRFQNLGDLIDRDRDPTKAAVIDLGGEDVPTEYCYAALDAMAMAVARALTGRGFARGDRIAIVSANRIEFLAAYYGIMRAGFVAVPVNYRFPQKTIHLILENAGAKMVFCDQASRVNCPEG